MVFEMAWRYNMGKEVMDLNYILCLLSSVCSSSGGIFIKQYERKSLQGNQKSGGYSFYIVVSLIALLFYAVTGMVGDGLVPTKKVLLYALLYGVGYVLGTVGYLRAVACGSLLISTVVSRMGCMIPILFSLIVYHEKMTVVMAVGMVLLLLALILFNNRGSEGGQKLSARFFGYVFLSFFGNGTVLLTIKMQQHDTPGEHKSALLFFGMLTTGLIFVGMLLVDTLRKKREKIDKNEDTANRRKALRIAVFWSVLYAVSNAASNYLGTMVISRLPAVVYYMCMTGFGILLSFFIARFLYREKLRVLQYVGCAIAAVGLILLTAF